MPDAKQSIKLNSDIQHIKGVGPKMAAKFGRLGIKTALDLIYYYPRTYKDYTKITRIGDIQPQNYGDPITIRGKILGIANKKTSKRRFVVTEAVVGDDSGSIKVVWFNQPFLNKTLFAGREVILNGPVNFNFYSKEVVMESPDRTLKPMIVPVYSETAGLSSHYIWRVVVSVKHLVSSVEEYLPDTILGKYKLMPLQEALEQIHEPKTTGELKRAKRRIAFDELFLIALQANLAKQELQKESAPQVEDEGGVAEDFVMKLPFDLTEDQKSAVGQILADLKQGQPMNRLLNGDVGSGKTVVAAIASMVVVSAGFKVVLMAPTEILASQHFDTFKRFFSEDRGMKIGLWTANSKKRESGIKNLEMVSKSHDSKFIIQDSDIIIGTQALIQTGVEIENIGLVIVDEQHRFGVKQRGALSEMKANREIKPHFLSMTATPIPRTMHLALFGDLELSIIKQKPSNRKEIKTRLVEPRNRDKAYEFIRAHLKADRQVFVICPLIEEKEIQTESGQLSVGLLEDERKTVKREHEKLQKIFPEYSVEMLHGRMKSREKDEVMKQFSQNKIQILVSTSVVEVGVDIPNATVMMIEDAERFGLAQLHQFRGRVGRGEHQSFCFLFSSTAFPKAIRRLKAMESTNDGFRLAETDLEERGPGAIFGTEQSGILDLKMASFTDLELMQEASGAAKETVKSDYLHGHPLLYEKVSRFLADKHLE